MHCPGASLQNGAPAAAHMRAADSPQCRMVKIGCMQNRHSGLLRQPLHGRQLGGRAIAGGSCSSGRQLAGMALPGGRSNGTAARLRAAQWLESSAEQSVGVPVEHAYSMWEDRTRIPQWMPWISSVTVMPEDERLSKWELRTEQLGRTWEFSWLAQNLTPTKLQKIHWRSVQGSTGGSLGSRIDIANRGQIRFYRKGPAACSVKLTISYEVPDILAPLASTVTPIVENILATDLRRFAMLAEQESASVIT